MKWWRRLFGERRSAAVLMASTWQRTSRQLLHRLKRDRKQLISLQSKLQQLNNQLEEDLDAALRAQQSYETAIDALRSENQILSETTVPTLVAQNKLLLQRYDTELAIQARRQVAAGLSERPDDET